MRLNDRFAVRSTASLSIVTSGTVVALTRDCKDITVRLRLHNTVLHFKTNSAGRTYVAEDRALYFVPTFDTLPTDF